VGGTTLFIVFFSSMQFLSHGFRPASITDLEQLAPLFDAYRVFYGKPSDPAAARAFLQERFSHLQSLVFLAFVDGEAVGFTQLYPSFSSVSLRRTYVLNDLFVLPEFRGRGVARGLLALAESQARQLGALRLTLSTAHTNTEAQRLYQAAGWQQDADFAVFHRML